MTMTFICLKKDAVFVSSASYCPYSTFISIISFTLSHTWYSYVFSRAFEVIISKLSFSPFLPSLQAIMKFPQDYPYSPPSIRFITKVWHPNVYENGDLCISILHPAVDDPQSGELPCERWNPTQNVRTILLSVISLLNEPNTFSPANVDASVMYRRWRDSNGRDNEYPNIIRKQALQAKTEAEKEGVVVPLTLEEYCLKPKTNPNVQEPQVR